MKCQQPFSPLNRNFSVRNKAEMDLASPGGCLRTCISAPKSRRRWHFWYMTWSNSRITATYADAGWESHSMWVRIQVKRDKTWVLLAPVVFALCRAVGQLHTRDEMAWRITCSALKEPNLPLQCREYIRYQIFHKPWLLESLFYTFTRFVY